MHASHTAAPRRGEARRSQQQGSRCSLLCAVALAACALGSAPSAKAQLYYEPLPEEYYADDRVRFGAEAQLGGSLGEDGGLGLGVAISIGLQLNDIIATYAVHRLWLTDLIGEPFAMSFNAAVLDLTIFEWFSFGAGPSLDVGIGGLCTDNAVRCDGLSDLRAGVEIRFAAVIGERTRARRRGLVIVASAHPTFVERNVAMWTLALGVGHQMF